MSGSPIQISSLATQLEHIAQDAWISTAGLMVEYDPEAISTIALLLEYIPPTYGEADILTSSSLVASGSVIKPSFVYGEADIITSSSLVSIGNIAYLPRLTNISTMYEYQFPATGLTNISVMYEYAPPISGGNVNIVTSSSMIINADNYTDHHAEVDIITTSSFVPLVRGTINAFSNIITTSELISEPGGVTYARTHVITETEMISIGKKLKGGNPWYYYAQL
jgi:hypothetical protein